MVNSTTLGRLWPPAHAGGLAAGDQGDLGAGQLVGVLGMRQAGGQRDDQGRGKQSGAEDFHVQLLFSVSSTTVRAGAFIEGHAGRPFFAVAQTAGQDAPGRIASAGAMPPWNRAHLDPDGPRCPRPCAMPSCATWTCSGPCPMRNCRPLARRPALPAGRGGGGVPSGRAGRALLRAAARLPEGDAGHAGRRTGAGALRQSGRSVRAGAGHAPGLLSGVGGGGAGKRLPGLAGGGLG